MKTHLLPVQVEPALSEQLPEVLQRAGSSARFAWEEFFYAKIRNEHTRRAYMRSVRRLLDWCHERSIPLAQISPANIGQFLDGLTLSLPSKKQSVAALRHFFDCLVTRHAIALNPALSVRTERYSVIEGKTLEISPQQARRLLESIDCSRIAGLRDKVVISVLVYTAARVGAVARLQLKDFVDAGDQYYLRFIDKGGKDREIPVRHDLQQLIQRYLQWTQLQLSSDPQRSLLTTCSRSRDCLTLQALEPGDIRRMLKRRLRKIGLSTRLSPHSFRVTTITDLLSQGVPLEDVQLLAGHSDPRTTRLYDRRQRKVNRNIVERISI
jgi:site-specific recombinase XerD